MYFTLLRAASQWANAHVTWCVHAEPHCACDRHVGMSGASQANQGWLLTQSRAGT
jgi:hypothetical protein